jgi:hypothetical protein
MSVAPIRYGEMDGFPVVWSPSGQAWWYARPRQATNIAARVWRVVNTAEADMNAKVVTKTVFEDWFPGLPPLPETAATVQPDDYEAAA